MSRSLSPLTALLIGLGALTALPASALQDLTPQQAERQHQRDKARCQKQPSGVQRSQCLEQALERYLASHSTADESPEQLARNRLKRCELHEGDERSACLARMQGQGTISGSVEAGGIYRELVQREPAPKPAEAAASATSGTQ